MKMYYAYVESQIIFYKKLFFFQFSLALYVEKFISYHKYYKYIFLSNFISVQIIYFLNF